jgi:hypothetical protein
MEVSGKTVLGVTYWQVLCLAARSILVFYSYLSTTLYFSKSKCRERLVIFIHQKGASSPGRQPFSLKSPFLDFATVSHSFNFRCVQAFSSSGLMSALLFETAIIAIQVIFSLIEVKRPS